MHRVYPTLCLLAALAAVSCGRAPDRGGRIAETRRHMGVAWTITAYGPADTTAAAIAAAHDEVARLEKILSDYDPSSELSRLSAAAPTGGPVPIGDDLCRVLARAIALRDATDGAFDPAVGPLTTLWRRARRAGVLPDPDKLAVARAAIGRDALDLDADRRTVTLTRPGMRLDLGGIGMGDAVDRAMGVLHSRGIEAAMIDASGDIAVLGRPPAEHGWRVAIAPLGRVDDATAPLLLVDAAVTTSGDAFQAVTIDGVRYGHVVDPRTGLGVVGPAAVTVIAPDCTTADALATATLVLGPDRGLPIIEATPGCAALFVWTDEEGKVRQNTSGRWPTQTSQPAK
jgi:thiamine biosynthesis lipoprotein